MEFSEWLVGFMDAEGNLLIDIKSSTSIKFRVVIKLHVDGPTGLYTIQTKLKVGVVRERIGNNKNESIWEVNKIEDIRNVILPVFDSYSFLTVKKINYLYFKQAISLWTSYNKIDMLVYEEIVSLKSKMNTKLDPNIISNYNQSILENGPITPNWLVGFIEGEGTFGYQNSRPCFSFSQHIRSQNAMYIVSKTLNKIIYLIDYPVLPPVTIKISTGINKSTQVETFSVRSIDAQYYIILPFFYNLKFYSRKEIDFL